MALAALVLGVSALAVYTGMTGTISCSSTDPVPVIVAFGDSLVSGYGASEGKDAFSVLSDLSGVPIRNFGVSGDTSVRSLARIETVLAEKPDIVIVLVGGNDALQRLPVSETEAAIGSIVERIKAEGSSPILVGIIGGFPTDPYAPVFERVSREYGVPLVPDILAGLIGREEFMSDPIHPNDAGYAAIAERLLPVLEAVCASS